MRFKTIPCILALFFFSCTDGPEQITPIFDSSLDSSVVSKPDATTDDLHSSKNDTSPDVLIGTDVGSDTSTTVCECENGQICVLDLCIPDLNKNTAQRHNLSEPPATERFALPIDRVWPSDTNSPHIALWHDDNYAAVSITIDDNPGPDFDWWIATSDQFGIKVTWCVISDNVENGNTFFGTWADYQRLFANGHALCSHGNVDSQPPDVNAGNAMAWFEDAYKLSKPGDRIKRARCPCGFYRPSLG